jgi:hypothetical protein
VELRKCAHDAQPSLAIVAEEPKGNENGAVGRPGQRSIQHLQPGRNPCETSRIEIPGHREKIRNVLGEKNSLCTGRFGPDQSRKNRREHPSTYSCRYNAKQCSRIPQIKRERGNQSGDIPGNSMGFARVPAAVEIVTHQHFSETLRVRKADHFEPPQNTCRRLHDTAPGPLVAGGFVSCVSFLRIARRARAEYLPFRVFRIQ